MISFCLLFSVNLPFLPLSFSLAASFAAKTTFSVEPREFSMLTARCLATLPAKEIREQKVQVGSGVGGGGSCQQCWQSVNPARCAFSSMISCVVPFPLHSPSLSLPSLAFSALPLTFAPLPICTANEQCWRLRCKRVDRQLGLCANIWHGRGWRVIEKGRGARDC